ncbi:MAG: hypothetical protein SFY80_02505 [Verrucomicrobiota bacterium]|nr:hypothetical protein [Verrucomicrobiota bacterium]
MNRILIFQSSSTPELTLNIIKSALKEKGVHLKANNQEIVSDYIDIPFISLDRRLYSKGNWIGINPFVHIDSCSVKTTETKNGTNLIFSYTQYRPIFPLVFMLLVFAGAWTELPLPIKVFCVIVPIAYTVFEFHILGSIAIKAEIQNLLQQVAGRDATRWRS